MNLLITLLSLQFLLFGTGLAKKGAFSIPKAMKKKIAAFAIEAIFCEAEDPCGYQLGFSSSAFKLDGKTLIVDVDNVEFGRSVKLNKVCDGDTSTVLEIEPVDADELRLKSMEFSLIVYPNNVGDTVYDTATETIARALPFCQAEVLTTADNLRQIGCDFLQASYGWETPQTYIGYGADLVESTFSCGQEIITSRLIMDTLDTALDILDRAGGITMDVLLPDRLECAFEAYVGKTDESSRKWAERVLSSNGKLTLGPEDLENGTGILLGLMCDRATAILKLPYVVYEVTGDVFENFQTVLEGESSDVEVFDDILNFLTRAFGFESASQLSFCIVTVVVVLFYMI